VSKAPHRCQHSAARDRDLGSEAINGPSAGNQTSISWQSMGNSGANDGQSVLITCAAPPDGPLYEDGVSGRSPLAPTRRAPVGRRRWGAVVSTCMLGRNPLAPTRSAPVRVRRARPRRRVNSPHECGRTCDREANQLQSVLISTNQCSSVPISAHQYQLVLISTNRHQSVAISQSSHKQSQSIASSHKQSQQSQAVAINRNQSQAIALTRRWSCRPQAAT
jgi:hypothetical protein